MNIFLDMDGVIVNFVKGVFNWFNQPYEPEKITSYHSLPKFFGYDSIDFWNIIKTPAFWEHLEFYPEAISFIKRLQQFGLEKSNNVILLTSPAHGCAGYRQNWIQDNLPEFFNQGKYIITPTKEYCAQQKTILIDDHITNYEKFISAGGNAILFPQPWNAIYKEKRLSTSYFYCYLTEKNKYDYVLRALSTFNI